MNLIVVANKGHCRVSSKYFQPGQIAALVVISVASHTEYKLAQSELNGCTKSMANLENGMVRNISICCPTPSDV